MNFFSSSRSRSSPPKPRSARQTQPPPPVHRPSASHEDLPSPRTARLAALQKLSDQLIKLKSEFTPPARLDFQPSATQELPKLAFTAENAPVLGYDEALLKLMIALDGVESEGDTVVRQARKKLVREVDAELAGLDELKKGTFEAGGQVPASYFELQEGEKERQLKEQKEKVDRMLHSAGAPPAVLNRHSNPNGQPPSNKRAEPQSSPQPDGLQHPPQAYQPPREQRRDDRGSKVPRHEPSRTQQSSYANASSRGAPGPRTSEPQYAPPPGLPPSHQSHPSFAPAPSYPQPRQAPAWVRPPSGAPPPQGTRPPPPPPTRSERERAMYAKEREQMELERMARERERDAMRWR